MILAAFVGFERLAGFFRSSIFFASLTPPILLGDVDVRHRTTM
jgi:hypothetical protein